MVAWSGRLEPAAYPTEPRRRPDDPRLGEIIEPWNGDPATLRPGRAVLIGFPQDAGVRRNGGRPGAAEAPRELRRWLARMTTCDPAAGVDLAQEPPLDLGDVRVGEDVEKSQEALGAVVAALLTRGAVPILLGGGHETAFGHYLGYVQADRVCGIINIDAHLDVRPLGPTGGHSGSPFRQALEHPTHPLTGSHYVCLGAQPHATSRTHSDFVQQRGGVIRWQHELMPSLEHHVIAERDRLAAAGCAVLITVDADVVRMADVPGVSAPNPAGLPGDAVIEAARRAGASPQVASFDLVEINPRHDRDGQSARWGAVLLWNFLIGLRSRAIPR